MNINPNDYSREERRRLSWRGSRGKVGLTHSSALRQGRRLTLIDMLLLAVMAALLVPWAIHRNQIHELGDYQVRLKRSESELETAMILTVSLPRNAEDRDGGLVGWKIVDNQGNLFHEDYDIPPEPGNFREFVAGLDRRETYTCILIAGPYEKTVEIPPAGNRVDGR